MHQFNTKGPKIHTQTLIIYVPKIPKILAQEQVQNGFKHQAWQTTIDHTS